MLSVGVTMIIWGIIFLGIDIWILVYALRFLNAARQSKVDAENVVKKVEIRTRKEYNKIATLPPVEMHTYLTKIFARCLELITDEEINSGDPDAAIELFNKAAQSLILYLGEETVTAIEYYYGDGYIVRWASQAYHIMEKRGMAYDAIHNKDVRAESIERYL